MFQISVFKRRRPKPQTSNAEGPERRGSGDRSDEFAKTMRSTLQRFPFGI
ncbi:hypothetical protein J2T57_002187 [Natronocella acetinitrilica]|jgi:hypothetical protein|uniref:Uncharacterized protein n=1 Tax=Natronocella acetinitrilica TaxID=414046 RepID=A0AAE3G3M5_9GAMM|nr:hypothetical protein [Natronocella acetinitrilica]MCP1675039.1 hypothetical protein [Natronocella acetinitrilica]